MSYLSNFQVFLKEVSVFQVPVLWSTKWAWRWSTFVSAVTKQDVLQLSLSNFPFCFKSLLGETNEEKSANFDNVWSWGEGLPRGFMVMWHLDAKTLLLLSTMVWRPSVSGGRAVSGYQRARATCLLGSQVLSWDYQTKPFQRSKIRKLENVEMGVETPQCGFKCTAWDPGVQLLSADELYKWRRSCSGLISKDKPNYCLEKHISNLFPGLLYTVATGDMLWEVCRGQSWLARDWMGLTVPRRMAEFAITIPAQTCRKVLKVRVLLTNLPAWAGKAGGMLAQGHRAVYCYYCHFFGSQRCFKEIAIGGNFFHKEIILSSLDLHKNK